MEWSVKVACKEGNTFALAEMLNKEEDEEGSRTTYTTDRRQTPTTVQSVMLLLQQSVELLQLIRVVEEYP